jgi:protein-L-isoaspartate(D-aspartate) O-methyltransferase
MGHLVGEHGRVTTIDIDQDIVEAAQAHLAAAKCQNVTVICGDGIAGYAANAPYDRIILTVGGWEIAPAWLEQLQSDGRLLLPLSLKGPQFAIAFEWQDGRLVSHSVRDCGFMRLRGSLAGPYQLIAVGPDDNVLVGFEEDAQKPRLVPTDNIYEWLNATYEEVATGIQVTSHDVWRSLMFWLAIHEPRFVNVSLKGEMVASQKAPYLFGADSQFPWRATIGLLHETGLAVVVRPPGHLLEMKPPPEKPETFELYVRCYGDGETAVAQLLTHLQQWHAAGRPHSANIQVEVYPINIPIPEGIAIPRRWHTFVVRQN